MFKLSQRLLLLISILCVLLSHYLATQAQDTNWITSIAWNPEGTQVAYSDRKGNVTIANLSQSSTYLLHNETPVNVLHWVATNTLISGDGAGIVKFWDLGTKTVTASLSGHQDGIVALSSDSNLSRLASASRNGFNPNVYIWDLKSHQLINNFNAGDLYVISWHPNKDLLLIGRDEKIDIYDVTTTNLVKSIETLGFESSVLWNPSNSQIIGAEAYTGDDAAIRVRDLNSGAVTTELKGHTNVVLSLDLNPSKHKLLSASTDHTVRVWSLATGASNVIYQGKAPFFSAKWSPFGGRIALVDLAKSAPLKMLPNGVSSGESSLQIIAPPQTKQDLKDIVSSCVLDNSLLRQLQGAIDHEVPRAFMELVQKQDIREHISLGCLADILAVASQFS